VPIPTVVDLLTYIAVLGWQLCNWWVNRSRHY